MVRTSSEQAYVPSFSVDTIVDTVGAGERFHRRLDQLAPKKDYRWQKRP